MGVLVPWAKRASETKIEQMRRKEKIDTNIRSNGHSEKGAIRYMEQIWNDFIKIKRFWNIVNRSSLKRFDFQILYIILFWFFLFSPDSFGAQWRERAPSDVTRSNRCLIRGETGKKQKDALVNTAFRDLCRLWHFFYAKRLPLFSLYVSYLSLFTLCSSPFGSYRFSCSPPLFCNWRNPVYTGCNICSAFPHKRSNTQQRETENKENKGKTTQKHREKVRKREQETQPSGLDGIIVVWRTPFAFHCPNTPSLSRVSYWNRNIFGLFFFFQFSLLLDNKW